VVLAALVAAGSALPAVPTSADAVPPWVGRHGADVALMVGAHLLALVAWTYLAGVTVVASLARRPGARSARIALGHLPGRLPRLLAEGIVGSGLVAGTLVAGAPGAAAADPPEDPRVERPAADEPAVMVPLDERRAHMVPLEDAAPPPTTEGEPGPTVTATTSTSEVPLLGPSPAPPPGAPAPLVGASTEAPPADEASTAADPPVVVMRSIDPEAAAPEAPPAEEAAPATTPNDDTWTVELGDHLWAIAEETLRDAGVPAGDDEVASYWRELVDANRDRLADPTDPDLLFPGQVLVVPPVAVSAG
jgi:nucleoid-associated protein YgaU